MKQYILALDQGTSSSRAIVFDKAGTIKSVAQKEFTQYFPSPGLVEHDPMEIWSSEREVAVEALKKIGIGGEDLAAIGITNQRETTIVWDAVTGLPVHNAIVWQDRRTAPYCDTLKAKGLTDVIRAKTGLIIDAYFSATKVRWILENVPGARERAERGELRFGTVDSWLVWNLTGGRTHVTDVTNAARTMLFNIHSLDWDSELLELFGIPESMLPKVCSSSEVYDDAVIFGSPVPIGGIAGDQQSGNTIMRKFIEDKIRRINIDEKSEYGAFSCEPDVVDDTVGNTLVSASTLEKDVKSELEKTNNVDAAAYFGTVIAKRALEKGIKTVVFDRGGFIYQGKVAALAEAAREAGLEF